MLGRYIEALDEIDIAESIPCRMEDCHAPSKTLIDQGNILRELGRHRDAGRAYQGALAAARVSGSRGRESDALGNLGAVADRLGDLTSAEQLHRQALEISRGLEDN